MQYPVIPRHLTTGAATALAALGLLFGSNMAMAQTTRTYKGHFHSSDGNHGSYVETVAINGDTKTRTIVYTRESDKETSTDIDTRTVTSPTTTAISYSHTDYGSTAEYTSQKTRDKIKDGFVATGTYKTAAGVTGTLRAVETNAADVNSVSTDYTASTGAVTNELRVEEDALGFVAVRVLTLEPDGTSTTVVKTRSGHEE